MHRCTDGCSCRLMITEELIKEVTVTILSKAETSLPGDVKEALARAYHEETDEIARVQLKAMLENVKLAEELHRPLCQDTGIPLFFVKLGRCDNISLVDIERGIRAGVKEATETIPLRPNVVDPITRKGEGNTGKGIPHVNYEVADTEIEGLEITAFPKGGGSENVSVFKMLTPVQGRGHELERELKQFVLDAVLNARGKPCPPTIIGIGIGGSADMAMWLAKAALLRPVGSRHHDAEIARIERELLDAVNSLGVGPMGLGGKTTALDLHIKTADTHITSLPVAINFQCWSARKASARIYPDGTVDYL